MHEAIIYGVIILLVFIGIFGLCLIGSRVQRTDDESKDHRRDIERQRETIDRLRTNKRELEREQRDRTEALKQNNTTARDANNKTREILRNAKRIDPTRED